MKNKKIIVVAAFLTMLGVGLNADSANINSLMQMDIKKSSIADTVDVIFYTTGDMSNSVVSRKANNRYVVLLPNISSTPNVAPSIGAVKDLVSNIDIKHVDDGIGGYTKVTFTTLKPINIKTYTRKTEPLSQAQKDSKALIAKNNVKPTITPISKPQTSAEKPAVNKQNTSNTTLVNNKVKPVKSVAAPKSVANEMPKPKFQLPKIKQEKPTTNTAEIQPKQVVKTETTVQKSIETPKLKNNTIDFVHSNYEPKMKFDKNGKRLIDLEPRVSHSIETNNGANSVKTDPIFNINEENLTAQLPAQEVPVAVDTPSSENTQNQSNIPNWIFLAGGLIFGLGLIYLIFDAIAHKKEKGVSKLDSFFQTSELNNAKRRRREYYDIVYNDDLNWQEKYKLYTEKEEKRKSKKSSNDISYITNLSGTQKAILTAEENLLNKPQKSKTDKFKQEMQAKISQMEHSLAQTPTLDEPEFSSNEVKSEDNVITNKLSNFGLKSFAKTVSLKETHRSLLDNEKKISRNKSYKQGRFVKLKNSPLSVTKRQSAATGINAGNLIETGNKYLTNNNNGVIKMNKEKENYLLSSLDEYLSILDTEEPKKSPVSLTQSLSQLKTPNSQAMSRSGVTNPISQHSIKPSVSPYMNGLIVKSGYNIDSEKGFYMVNMDGTSALVGRINDNVFILKKFDKIVDKPMQVRAEDESIYIVRVGQFKCLVDVSKDKMGTLIEI